MEANYPLWYKRACASNSLEVSSTSRWTSLVLTYLENHVSRPVAVVVETTLELERTIKILFSVITHYSECNIPKLVRKWTLI